MMRVLSRIATLVLGVFAMSAAFAATDGPVVAESGSGVKIVVEVFSGRPNPTFTLEDAAALGRLREAFERLPAEGPESAQDTGFNRLGYRGIVIENPRGVAGIPRYAQALNGVVLVRDEADGASRYFRDTESLEKNLLALAAERGLIRELIAAGLVPDPGAM